MCVLLVQYVTDTAFSSQQVCPDRHQEWTRTVISKQESWGFMEANQGTVTLHVKGSVLASSDSAGQCYCLKPWTVFAMKCGPAFVNLVPSIYLGMQFPSVPPSTAGWVNRPMVWRSIGQLSIFLTCLIFGNLPHWPGSRYPIFWIWAGGDCGGSLPTQHPLFLRYWKGTIFKGLQMPSTLTLLRYWKWTNFERLQGPSAYTSISPGQAFGVDSPSSSLTAWNCC